MRDRRLGDAAAIGEVAGAHLRGPSELAQDLQSGRVGERGEQENVRVRRLGHGVHHIDTFRY